MELLLRGLKELSDLIRSKNSEFVALLKQANTDSSKMAEVIGVSDAQLRFVTNSQSGMGPLKCGNVVIPFDNQISKDTSLYKLCNTNLHEIIQEQKAKEKQKNSLYNCGTYGKIVSDVERCLIRRGKDEKYEQKCQYYYGFGWFKNSPY